MSRLLSLSLLTLLVSGLCFAAGIYLAKRMDRKKRARRKRHAHTLPLSAFSTLDHPVHRNAANDLTPINEARIFLTYGKKAQALEVLNMALAKNRITREEFDAFIAQNEIQ